MSGSGQIAPPTSSWIAGNLPSASDLPAVEGSCANTTIKLRSLPLWLLTTVSGRLNTEHEYDRISF